LIASNTDADFGAGLDETGGNAVADDVGACEEDDGAGVTVSGVEAASEVLHGPQKSVLLLSSGHSQRRKYMIDDKRSDQPIDRTSNSNALRINPAKSKRTNNEKEQIWSEVRPNQRRR
jgi:hypothetical protein